MGINYKTIKQSFGLKTNGGIKMDNNQFITILKLDQQNINGNIVINIKDCNKVKMSKYNFMILALEKSLDKTFKDNEFVVDFFKLTLSNDESKAKKQWFDGVFYNGNKYIAWFATTGGMKQEGVYGKCETIFIREDLEINFKRIETAISLGTFEKIKNMEKVCINKDVLSRLSLITSDLITEIDMPNIIILPQCTISLFGKYKTVQPKSYWKKDKQVISYDLLEIDEEINFDKFDGCGIGTPKVFDSIGKSLNREDVEFAIIRGYGNATKGLITKFDIIEYLNEFFRYDTEYCRKTQLGYEFKDMFNDWRPVTDNTILANESMVKLAKYFKNHDDYISRLEYIKTKEGYEHFYPIMSKLYITKVNKPDNKVNDYRQLNYQLLNVLALTPSDILKLSEQDRKLYKKILKPYEHDERTDEFYINADYIQLFYNQCVDAENEESEDTIIQTSLNVVDKIQELVNINPEFVKLNEVKMNLRRMVETKVRDLASGKITVRANYQHSAGCPISYLNYAIYRNMGDNGLNKSEFYTGMCNHEEIRTISRNPIAAYSEVHNIKFVRNKLFDKYFCKSKELIYYNQKSDIELLMSSQDHDGDGVLLVNEDIIKNSLITPPDGRHFISKLDGKKVELKYTPENRFISTYQASGNLIGTIAMMATHVNSNAQRLPDWYDNEKNKFISRDEISDINFVDFDNFKEYNKALNDYIDEKIDTGEFENVFNCDQNKLKQYIINRFIDNEKDIYICLYNSMAAIDAPKTLTFLSKSYMKEVTEKYNSRNKKMYFLKYKDADENINSKDYHFASPSLLDRFAKKIDNNLLSVIKNSKTRFTSKHKMIQDYLSNDIYNDESVKDCLYELNTIYKSYNSERDIPEKICKYNNRDLWEYKTCCEKAGEWHEEMNFQFYSDIKNNKEQRNIKWKEIDAKYNMISDNLIFKFDESTVAQAISQMEKCTEKFIINLFFRCFKVKECNRTIFIECEDGEIEYLYKKYKRVCVRLDNSVVVDKLQNEKQLQLGNVKKVRFYMNDRSVIDDIESSLLRNGYHILDLNDNRINLMNDYIDSVKGNMLKVIRFDIKNDGVTKSISNKSFGVIVEEDLYEK